MRLGAYIQVVLEPALPPLRWESTLEAAWQRASDEDDRPSGLLRRGPLRKALISSYSVFCGIVFAATTMLLTVQPPTGRLRWIADSTLFGMSVIGMTWAVRRELRLQDYRAKWKEALRGAIAPKLEQFSSAANRLALVRLSGSARDGGSAHNPTSRLHFFGCADGGSRPLSRRYDAAVE
jgi:hypothetical protein